jgi:FixJ family two-component response regulator
MKMPKMSGIELLKKVKEKFPEVNVIVVTGYATVDSALEAMKSGASDYVEKPVSSDQFSQAVAKAIEKAGTIEVPTRKIEPEEIFPVDYREDTREEWENVLEGFRSAVVEGRIDYDVSQGWTYEEMQQELVNLLTNEIARKMRDASLNIKDVTRFRPTLNTICEMVSKGNLKVLLERWVEPFWSPRVGLNVDRKYFEPLFLTTDLKCGAAERKLKAFEREIYRGNLCAAREWGLNEILDSFNDYDRLFRGGCFGRRKCHMENISVCKLGFDEINKCC